MKSVLILTNCIYGLHSFRKEVVKAIIDTGYVVYISFPDEDERSKYFEEIGCKLIKTDFNRTGMNPIKDLQLLNTYVQLIRKLNPIAVLTYTIKPNIYGGIAAAICKVPHFANVTGLGDTIENPGLLRTLTVGLYKFGLRKSRVVFFQNKANLQSCVNLGIVKEEKTHLLPGSGVNTDYHTYQEYPEDTVVKFLFIARLKKDKGTQEYFDAATAVKTKYPNTEFQIVGFKEANYDNQLSELESKGIIMFLGPQTDVRPFIGNVHCTVMPSYHEGMSNVNLESSANGRPVITTNVPGCKETVEDGVTGLLCEAKNVEGLVEMIEKFINFPYEVKKQMGLSAREKMIREYDRHIVVDAYMNEIKNI